MKRIQVKLIEPKKEDEEKTDVLPEHADVLSSVGGGSRLQPQSVSDSAEL